MKILLLLIIFQSLLSGTTLAKSDGRPKYIQSDFINAELDRFIKENSGQNFFSIFHQLIQDSREIEKVTEPTRKSKNLYLLQTKDRQIQEIWSKNKKILSLGDIGFNSIKYVAQKVRFSPNHRFAAVFFRVGGNTEELKIFFIDLIKKRALHMNPLSIVLLPNTTYRFENNKHFIIQDTFSNFSYSYNIENLDYELKEFKQKKINNKFTLQSEQIGFEQKIIAINTESQKNYEMILPSNIINFNLTQNKDQVLVHAETQFQTGIIKWEPLLNKFEIPKNLLNDLTLRYTNILIKSFDGTEIPIRLISLKKNILAYRPVLIDSYGGFNMENLISKSNLNKMKLQFLERGGIIVTTGLRGGSEYGLEWHNAGRGQNKHKPVEDLASVAKWLIENKITRRDQIISYGASNGGFVVTLAGLKYPQYFGLIISNSGVLDLLHKEELDPIYGGWFEDFPNSNDSAKSYEYIKSISPLENIQLANAGPEFLFIYGKKDTRVNPEHSIRMGEKLKNIAGAKYNLVGIHSAGHYGISYQQNGQMGLRFQHLMWSKIYNFLGIKF